MSARGDHGAAIVDAHIHVGAWDHPDFLGRACTLADTLAELRAAGVGGACVMPSDQRDNAGLLAAARAHAASPEPLALWVLAWIHPAPGDGDGGGDPGGAPAIPADELAWIERNAGALAGLKIHPSLSRVRITDPAFAPALEVARDRDLVVLVHCGRWQQMASYRFAVEAARAWPTVRFVLAHAGGDTPPLATAAAALVAEHRVDNAWFEISGLREYWVTERNARALGADRYLLGSDYPLAHPRMYIAQVEAMDLSEADRARVLGGNARAVLGAPLALADDAAAGARER